MGKDPKPVLALAMALAVIYFFVLPLLGLGKKIASLPQATSADSHHTRIVVGGAGVLREFFIKNENPNALMPRATYYVDAPMSAPVFLGIVDANTDVVDFATSGVSRGTSIRRFLGEHVTLMAVVEAREVAASGFGEPVIRPVKALRIVILPPVEKESP